MHLNLHTYYYKACVSLGGSLCSLSALLFIYVFPLNAFNLLQYACTFDNFFLSYDVFMIMQNKYFDTEKNFNTEL